jgi:hypothetical protein
MSTTFAASLADAENQVRSSGFSTALWEPEMGWIDTEEEAAEPPFPPQLLAALQCFFRFFSAPLRRAWIHLAAEMQAGKTGVVNALIRLIFTNIRILNIRADRIFIITGMSDNAWLKQTRKRVPDAVRRGVAHSGGLIGVVRALRALNERAPLSNILLIIDESHIASSARNLTNKLVYEELARLCPREEWSGVRNIRILTISATDPAKSTIIADSSISIPVEVVQLQTSEAYQSVESLSLHGRLRYAEDHGDLHEATAIEELARAVATFPDPRYHILRPRKNKGEMVKSLLESKFPGCVVMPWDSDSRPSKDDDGSSSVKMDDINALLEVQPSVHTFILLKNMFYASKTMEDAYVGVLYDRVGGKDDTNLQSLLGRACGYGKRNDTIIYTCKQTVENYLKFWKEVIAGCPPPLTDIPVSKLDKKMAGQRVTEGGGGHAMPIAQSYASPAGGAAGGGGSAAAALPVREKKNEDDYTAEWREFNTLEEAKAWAKGVHKPQMKDGFYQTSTTKGPETLTYAQVVAMKGGKKTANLPKTEVGKSVNRLYVGYKDITSAESAVFFVRRVTRIR